MSIPATASPAAPAELPARFRDLVSAEWIKLSALRSTTWTVGLITLFVIGSAVVAALSDQGNFARSSLVDRQAPGYWQGDAYQLVGYLTLMLVAAAGGAGSIVSEYSCGLIRTTTIAVPARGSVLLAKAVVVTALWTVVGTVGSVASFVVSQAILRGGVSGIPFTRPESLWALVAASLLAPVCALIGVGSGAVIRHSAGTVTADVVVLLLLPQFFSPHHRWSAHLIHVTVFGAWQRLTEQYGPPAVLGSIYASFTGSWIVYAIWPLVAVWLGLLVVRRRDV